VLGSEEAELMLGLFICVLSDLSEYGEKRMSEDEKPAKAWWVNWLIIAGTIVVITILSQG
jgi:hypothetical protein